MNLTDAEFVSAVETVAKYKGVSEVKDILEIAQWVSEGAHTVSYASTTTPDNVVQLNSRKFKKHDRVKLVANNANRDWHGLPCVVVDIRGEALVLKPSSRRPWGGFDEFAWSANDVERDTDYYNKEW